MGIPDFQTLMLPVLRESAAGEVRISDVIERLADEHGLTPEERAELLPSGRQATFANRVHWARFNLVKAGLMDATRRGHIAIAEQGRALLSDPPDRITLGYLRRYPTFRDFKDRPSGDDVSRSSAEPPVLDATPEEALAQLHQQLTDALAADLLARVRAASPAFFEKLVVNLLVAMGYGGSTVSIDRALVGRSGDGGVDGVIDQDPLGLDRVYVQAKRYGEGNTVGAGAIRDFFGSLDRFKAAKGLFVTTSTFTREAEETAGMLSKRIVMIDGDRLVRLMIRHDVGCRAQEVLVLKRMDDDFFED